MKKYSLTELREKYLSFFESKGHLRLDSFPLVPRDDNSLLLINAGMAPLKRYFTGELEPPRKRITTCQKCVRTLDIDNVGKTARHGTFFEMLGNFSFGDYFKEDAIPWAWEFLTKVLEIPEDRLYITIYEKDDEAYDIWRSIGVPDERIFRMGKEDNFWEIGSGPCGPDSEIHFDRGPKYGCGKPDCAFPCDCDRFIEIWNIVFTQFDGDGNGNYTRLANPNIDTGMGLERLACIMQDVGNLFEVDTVRNIMLKLSEMTGVTYNASASNQDVSLRVITDHIRTATFLISDGVLPSNEGRGYILRRVLRRAARHGRLLGIKGSFLTELCETVISENASAYPELAERRDFIKKTIAVEEERFSQTLDAGLAILEKMFEAATQSGENRLCGADVFKLYDTFGFPIDLTRELAEEKGVLIDEEGFTALMKEQKKKARDARASLGDFGWSDDNAELIGKDVACEFIGYDRNNVYGEVSPETEIIAIIKDGELQSVISGENTPATIVLSKTPFYAESGGQVGDTGTIVTDKGVFVVEDTKKTANHQIIHIGKISSNGGEISLGKATAVVDAERRAAITRNHSAVHLMQAALRKVLGSHVEQSGSYVDAHRARFDFTHYQALSLEEIKEVELLVNKAILAGFDIVTEVMTVEEAKKTGAMALFGEKYGDTVRVVKMGEFSKELCGGTHLDNTAKAGLFKIVSESSVAAGVRRIEAITGLNVLDAINEDSKIIASVQNTLKATSPSEITKRAEAVIAEMKGYKKALDNANAQAALSKINELIATAEEINGIKIIKCAFDGIPVDALRTAADDVLSKCECALCVFATVNEGKVLFVSGCTKTAVSKGAHAGKLLSQISPICGGGGRAGPDRASSRSKNPEKLHDALNAVNDTVKQQTSK